MNYIREINAFYDRMEQEPLSGSAVSLWHTLLHINNKAHWAMEFTVASTVVKLKAGLSDSSFKRARTELKERGMIEYRSRGRNLSPIYRMKRLSREYQGGDLVKEEGQVGEEQMDSLDQSVDHGTDYQVDQQTDHGVNHHTDHGTAPLIKQKEMKQNKTSQIVDSMDKTMDAIAFYQENFGVISPFVSEEILGWITDAGEELVLEAMKRALERNRQSWGYVKSILKAWVKKGIRSVEDVHVDDMAWKNERGGSKRIGCSREVVPEWFIEQKRKSRVEKQMEVEVEDSAESVREMLDRYLAGS